MIDFHSHILPGIDDGARNTDMALEMLKRAYADGIDTVVSTSHIYIDDESDIDKFIERRKRAYTVLLEAMSKDGGEFPKIRLGCEVHLKPYIGNYDSVQKLAIDGTNYILLEMPYSSWSQDHYEAVYNIGVMGLRPIMANIERFLRYRSEFHHLKALDPIFQVNADAFLHKAMRKELLQMFYDGYVHLLGSDMHNLKERSNHLKEAYGIIEERFGTSFSEHIKKNALLVLDNKSIEKRCKFPKLGFFDKLKL